MKIPSVLFRFMLMVTLGIFLAGFSFAAATNSSASPGTPEEPITLTVENLPQKIKFLEQNGMAGVIYVRIRGKVVMKQGFGYADKALGTRNKIDTIFGTGSRPIDYTIAAIYLLDQKGLLTLEDPITRFFKEVPPDKQTITIRHLMTGQSGLPDFFDTPDDWDPDLSWVDRDTAVNRLLGQKLLFSPGEKREHSHGAFGLLAAIIEKTAQKPYYTFIRENFLDPIGMKRTGEYGESRGLQISDFASGGGPQIIGLPNIPPNWGPTSWLVKGSGGMYSTLDDLLAFYRNIRSGKILDKSHTSHFLKPSFNVDGSDRGFELFSAYMPPDTEIFLFLNEPGDRRKLQGLFRSLINLAKSSE